MTPAARRLLAAAQDLVLCRDDAVAAYRNAFRTGRMRATEEPLQAWRDADNKAREAWHEFVRCTAEATQEAAGASVPDPQMARLPLAVEMSQHCRQAELLRRFEECNQ